MSLMQFLIILLSFGHHQLRGKKGDHLETGLEISKLKISLEEKKNIFNRPTIIIFGRVSVKWEA